MLFYLLIFCNFLLKIIFIDKTTSAFIYYLKSFVLVDFLKSISTRDVRE